MDFLTARPRQKVARVFGPCDPHCWARLRNITKMSRDHLRRSRQMSRDDWHGLCATSATFSLRKGAGSRPKVASDNVGLEERKKGPNRSRRPGLTEPHPRKD